jgi:hypothetical protein
MEKAEETGIKFHYGEPMDALSALRKVWQEFPKEVDAADDAFERGDISPQVYFEKTSELIDACSRLWFVLNVERRLMASRNTARSTAAE